MYQYKYVKATLGNLFTSANHHEIIDNHAKEGWRLVQVLPVQHNGHGKQLFLVILCLITLILVGCSNNDEKTAQKTAMDYVMDLYTVDINEVENYKSLLNISPLEAMDLYDEVQINDEILKSLMTDDAYENLLKNRENLKFTEICYRKNYTIQVEDIQLSERKTDIEDNGTVYNFQVQIKLISNYNKEIAGTGKGTINLVKIDDNWKISGYKYTLPDVLRELLNQ